MATLPHTEAEKTDTRIKAHSITSCLDCKTSFDLCLLQVTAAKLHPPKCVSLRVIRILQKQKQKKMSYIRLRNPMQTINSEKLTFDPALLS